MIYLAAAGIDSQLVFGIRCGERLRLFQSFPWITMIVLGLMEAGCISGLLPIDFLHTFAPRRLTPLHKHCYPRRSPAHNVANRLLSRRQEYHQTSKPTTNLGIFRLLSQYSAICHNCSNTSPNNVEDVGLGPLALLAGSDSCSFIFVIGRVADDGVSITCRIWDIYFFLQYSVFLAGQLHH